MTQRPILRKRIAFFRRFYVMILQQRFYFQNVFLICTLFYVFFTLYHDKCHETLGVVMGVRYGYKLIVTHPPPHFLAYDFG